MEIVERSGAYCSGLIHAWPPVGLFVSFRGKDDFVCFMDGTQKCMVIWQLKFASETSDPTMFC
jgi:hypothetical protein